MSNKTKKLLILNLPYFIAGLVCTNSQRKGYFEADHNPHCQH